MAPELRLSFSLGIGHSMTTTIKTTPLISIHHCVSSPYSSSHIWTKNLFFFGGGEGGGGIAFTTTVIPSIFGEHYLRRKMKVTTTAPLKVFSYRANTTESTIPKAVAKGRATSTAPTAAAPAARKIAPAFRAVSSPDP